MNKAKLKPYAPQARKDFIAAVTARANLLGLSGNDGPLQIAPSQLRQHHLVSARKVGLVGFWGVVAFDEVAGINFKDHDGVQIMKDYMASGSFSRGRESINASAAMVFVGNLPQGAKRRVAGQNLALARAVSGSHDRFSLF
jgi:predicted ATP-dependent Lon-type protease